MVWSSDDENSNEPRGKEFVKPEEKKENTSDEKSQKKDNPINIFPNSDMEIKKDFFNKDNSKSTPEKKLAQLKKVIY